jgi:hypothetical protein
MLSNRFKENREMAKFDSCFNFSQLRAYQIQHTNVNQKSVKLLYKKKKEREKEKSENLSIRTSYHCSATAWSLTSTATSPAATGVTAGRGNGRR